MQLKSAPSGRERDNPLVSLTPQLPRDVSPNIVLSCQKKLASERREVLTTATSSITQMVGEEPLRLNKITPLKFLWR